MKAWPENNLKCGQNTGGWTITQPNSNLNFDKQRKLDDPAI